MTPLLADFIHARDCKPICAKLLTLPGMIVPEWTKDMKILACRQEKGQSCV